MERPAAVQGRGSIPFPEPIWLFLLGDDDVLTPAKTLLLALGLCTALGAASGASAETRFQATHPRRAEVNMRLTKLDHKVLVARHEGRMGPQKAKLVRAEVRTIRAQERLDARRHGGHITKVEQRRLNRAENGLARQIRP